MSFPRMNEDVLFQSFQKRLRAGELRSPDLNEANRRRFRIGPQVVTREAVIADRIVAMSDAEWERRLIERRQQRLAL